jgi:hypothetical protein
MSTLTLRSVKGSPLTNTEVDDNFTNLNTDKYQSGDSPSFAALTLTASHTAAAELIVAAGSVQGDATAITKTHAIVTTATADQGVQLTAAALGLTHEVTNETAVNVKVYPQTGENINDLASNIAIDLAPGATLKFVARDGTEFRTRVDVVIYDEGGNRLN